MKDYLKLAQKMLSGPYTRKDQAFLDGVHSLAAYLENFASLEKAEEKCCGKCRCTLGSNHFHDGHEQVCSGCRDRFCPCHQKAEKCSECWCEANKTQTLKRDTPQGGCSCTCHQKPPEQKTKPIEELGDEVAHDDDTYGIDVKARSKIDEIIRHLNSHYFELSVHWPNHHA